MKTYQITLTEKQREAVLIALGAKAWECRDTEAFETYDEAYKAISKQTNRKRRL